VTTSTIDDVGAPSFDELYQSTRGELFRALATITDDRDLTVEAIDIGFTRWRRKLRRPANVSPEVGVMSLAYRWAAGQLEKSSRQISGFRLDKTEPTADSSALERFRSLTLDERALVVMRTVLGWNDDEIGHAVRADGAASAIRAVARRLESDGYSIERLAAALASHGAGYVEPLSRLETVKTKGVLQKVLAFAGAAVGVTGVVLAGTALVSNIGSGDPTPENPDARIQPPAGTLTAENAVWERIPVPGGGENIMTVAHDGTDFFMLSTDNQGRPRMMQSANGTDWAQLPAPAVGRNMWFQQMIASPDVLMAVGNGFDERTGRESTAVFTSTDKETWSRANLPFEDFIEIDGRTLDLYTYVQSAAFSEAGFTIVGSQGAEFDPMEMLRGVVDDSLLLNGWGMTATGLQFFDNEGRIQETMTWEELGLSPEFGALLGGGRPIVWTSPDGIDWEAKTADGPPGTQGIGAYVTLDGLEAVLAYGDFAPAVWVKNGTEWGHPDLGATLTAMTVWNEQLIVAGSDNTTGETSVWKTTDGVDWDRTAVPGGSIQNLFASGNGIVGFGFGEAVNGLGPAVIEVDDLSVFAHSDGRFEVVDADGEVILDVHNEGILETEVVALVDPDSGEVVVDFERLELEQAWETVYRESEGLGGDGPPSFSLLFSSDGDSWTSLSPEDQSFYPQSVAYGNNSILLMGWSEGGGLLGFGGGGPQLFLVRPGN